MIKFDALALEYKRDYGTARGNINVENLVNNPAANGECRVLGLGLTEQGFNLLGRQTGALLQDRPDPLLVTQDSIQLLPH